MLRAVAPLAIVAVLAAPLANATDWCDSLVLDVQGRAYVATNGWLCHAMNCGPHFTYLYVESNGVPGLQRGGEGVWRGDTEQCSPDPDLLAF